MLYFFQKNVLVSFNDTIIIIDYICNYKFRFPVVGTPCRLSIFLTLTASDFPQSKCFAGTPTLMELSYGCTSRVPCGPSLECIVGHVSRQAETSPRRWVNQYVPPVLALAHSFVGGHESNWNVKEFQCVSVKSSRLTNVNALARLFARCSSIERVDFNIDEHQEVHMNNLVIIAMGELPIRSLAITSHKHRPHQDFINDNAKYASIIFFLYF